MKKAFLYLMTIALFATTSCSDDDDAKGASAEVAASLRSGTWRITSYIDNGTDETVDFNGFTFTFTNGGNVSAANSILTVTGAWSTGIDDSKHELDLDFSASSLSSFGEITEDWEIVAQNATVVSLRHVSGGSGQTDLLVFTKN